MTTADLGVTIEGLTESLVSTRREFHRIPELGFEEHETSALVAEKLRAMGLEPRTGVAKTGVVAMIEGGHPGPTLLVRADMDGLPIEERSGAEYSSKHPNRMHACGHDTHIAMLLASASVLLGVRDQLHGRVKLIFQPAEEGLGGAKVMMDEGVLEDPHVDAALGFHIWNNLPTGQVGVREGPVMASTDRIKIEIIGQGGHGALPHTSADAVVAAAHVVTALQTIVSRNVSPMEPAVVTIGTIHGGYAANIIADRVEMTGTVRSFNEDVWKQLPSHIERVVHGVCAALGVQGNVEYRRGYPTTVNDEGMTELVRAAAIEALGEEAVVYPERSTGGEDMSFILQAVPGCYFFIGSQNNSKGISRPHHHPEFNIDEDALPVGVKVITAGVLRYLSGEAQR
ncbi:MAG: amidohydrolase [Chloroflexia bacterium]